ncbi:hypothetical protein [Nonomuraea basaltis]|uniref:hypothetical protein n=1 Tax=Nonomuraea basaltis TaxID=2495887 RepID=UPI0019814974|nr:hypothetical protein [Nonomuraea basaltis]
MIIAARRWPGLAAGTSWASSKAAPYPSCSSRNRSSLWKQGRFPFDKLITTFPLSEINQAEAATIAGSAIKPVLLPGP